MKKIAILDTGICINENIWNNSVEKGVTFTSAISKSYNDDNGHGTACAQIITKDINDISLIPLKVLDENRIGRLSDLYQALKYLLDIDVDVINMSLSFSDSQYTKDFEILCEELLQQGKLLIASSNNRSNNAFPAIFRSVIGVGGYEFMDNKNIYFNKKAEIQALADNMPIVLEWKDKKSIILGGTSKATALMTNIIAKIDSREDVLDKLEKMSIKFCEMKKGNCKEKTYESNKDEYDREILRQIIKIVPCKVEMKKYLYQKELYDPVFMLKENDYIYLMDSLLNIYNIHICGEVYAHRLFHSIYSLEKFIKEKLEHE